VKLTRVWFQDKLSLSDPIRIKLHIGKERCRFSAINSPTNYSMNIPISVIKGLAFQRSSRIALFKNYLVRYLPNIISEYLHNKLLQTCSFFLPYKIRRAPYLFRYLCASNHYKHFGSVVWVRRSLWELCESLLSIYENTVLFYFIWYLPSSSSTRPNPAAMQELSSKV